MGWRLLPLLLAVLLVQPVVGRAQDSHYWTNQYGTRATFLGGAMVGGVRDASATFYNPGALGLIERLDFSVSATALRVSDLHVLGGVGGAADLDSEELEVIPLLLAGDFQLESLSDRHILAYSVLTRYSHLMKASARRESAVDVLTNPTAPGDEQYIGQFALEDRLVELWAGPSYAYRLSPHISLGISNFFAIRTQSFNRRTTIRAINQTAQVTAATDASANVEFWNLRLLWKLGVAAEYERWKLGLAVTTPSVNLAGSGTVSADFTVTNVDTDGDGTPDFFVGDDRQDNLDSELKSPLSIALGAEYRLTQRTSLAFSAEWFNQQDRYDVMSPANKEFIRSVGGFDAVDSRDFLRVTHAADEVLNFSVGAEHALSERLAIFTSFRTDYEYLPQDRGDGLPLGFTDWDIYHIALGTKVSSKSSDFGIGLTYSFGTRSDFPQLANFQDPAEEGFLSGEPGTVKVRYRAVSLVLGYTFYF